MNLPEGRVWIRLNGELGVSPISSVANVMSYYCSLSLILFDMKIIGTREGTVLSAFLTGFAVKFFIMLLKKPVEKILSLDNPSV